MTDNARRDTEQARHDAARQFLAQMRNRTERAADAADAANEYDAQVAEWTLRQRLRTMDDDPNGLFFGSIDGPDGEFYVGRRHIEDHAGEAYVVDWRAPAATPFYRATFADPFDLDARLRHTIEDHEVVAVFEERFDDPDHHGGGGVPDPLIAELERARTGEMRDIVATIQAEQDEVIRAPIDETIVVQGGPGTGKTAVGLHRAAFLMYEHRERLSREGVLVVGPNQRFLRYISQVLPSLGEHAVTQLTIDGLADPRRFATSGDSDVAAATKGSIVMVEVLRALARHHINPSAIEAPLGHRVLRLDEPDVADLIDQALRRGGPLNSAREGTRQALAKAMLERRFARHPGERPQADTLRTQLLKSRQYNTIVDKIWPTQSSSQLLRQLYSAGPTRDAVASDVLTDAERASLARPNAPRVDDEPWTSADLVLLAELEHMLNGGGGNNYGHIVVDEAQDLSAMALRLIGRRARRGSATILGDLAQATTPASQTSWRDTIEHLGVADGRVAELTVGYRLPAALLDAASVLLPFAAPGVNPSTSVRQGGQPPEVMATTEAQVLTDAVAVAAHWASELTSVALLAAPSQVEALTKLVEKLSLSAGSSIAVMAAVESKGLEFDAVVVVEPSLIAGGTAYGLRALYVAMTRAVQRVAIIHADPLPGALAGATADLPSTTSAAGLNA